MPNTLVFLGSTPSSSSQLYTLGAAAGTAVQTSLSGYGAGDQGPQDFTAFNSGQAFDGGSTTDQQLWTLSASGVATQITGDSLSPDLAPANLTSVGDTLFFSGTDNHGLDGLFVSDGTAAGTREVAVANAGASGLAPDEIVAANGRVFFSGVDASGSTGLWTSNGTTAGTVELAVGGTDTQDIAQMGVGLNPSNITVANGQIFFAGTDGAGSIGLWKSDGTAAGTTELTIGNTPAGGINPTMSNIVSFNGLTYFAGQDASGNIGLWVTDGSGGDTSELTVANSSGSGLAPVSLTVMDGSLYFGGTDASGNTGLWKSDGTAVGTTELQVSGTASGGLEPISLNASDYSNAPMAVSGNKLYFAGNGADGTIDLWSSDGTGAGTVQVSTPDSAGTATGVLPTDFAVLAGSTGSGATSVTATIVGAVAPLTLGTGHDTITFLASEDAYDGDAQFTVLVDGKQVGGVQTETALRSQSQAQKIMLNGDWGNGTHTLSIDFLNDAYGGSATTDRNLYASTATYNGVSATGSLALLASGTQSLTVGSAAPGTTTLGSGSDSITLQMSEDSFLGDAQFTVTVDGTQIGGVQTVTASYSAGQSQYFNLKGNFGPGSHTVGVDFLNDAAGSTIVQDRNLYVNSTSFDGTLVAQGALAEFSSGTQIITTGVAAAPVAQRIQVGNGTDVITLKVSEDAFVGDAQFTVAVDGKQVGGIVTAQDPHAAGLDQTLLVVGDFGAGQHQVSVTYLNDLSGPNLVTQDRNLYVDGATYDGSANAGSLALMTNGTQALTVGTPVNTGSATIGSGFDDMTVKLSEDFYQGNAQYVVDVDGVQVGGVQTATALHASGQDTTLNVLGNFGAGQHTLSVSFLNDSYAGSASTDRNLYVDGTGYNGAAGGGMTLLSTGTMSEVVGTARQSTVNLGSGSDTVSLKISEDYFAGDAQFTVGVDGHQIGGVQIASAQRAAGQDTTYNVSGNFGSGQHQVFVNFLNDASGPNILTQDRNLYVDGASYDGIATPNATLALLGAGTQVTTVGTASGGTIGLGTGVDTISLQLSEDFFAGDAQYTLAVDGKQIGGVLTASTIHGSGQEQVVNLSGNFGPGQHALSVNFLNDAYAGSASTDRNLYLDSASYNGVTTQGASLALLGAGTQTVAVGNPMTTVTVGSGSDTVGLKVSEDYFQGDAQFTISVDGHQVGGTLVAGAQHASGQDQTFNVLGNFGAGSHVVSLDFLNDANGPGGDRNLYVDGTTFDGKAVTNGAIGIPAAVPGSIAIPGTDTLTLHMSEDAYLGDAQFDVYVDGKQVGGTMTATASHGAGQTQAISLAGSWGAGTHIVGFTFLNDAYGGSPDLNRNLYIDSVGFNGGAIAENFELGVNGGASFAITTANTYTPGAGGGTIATLGNDTVNAGAGFVTVGDNGPSTLINGGSGGMRFFNNTGSATVTGGSGADTIIGSGGNLAFTDGTGATSITAGSAKELYTIVNGQAGNTLDLYGFNPSNDHVYLQGYSGSGIVSQQVSGGSTQIVLADNTKIVLHSVTNLTNTQIFG